MRPNFFAFLSGLVFAAGLAVSGMTLPQKVLGFLDLGGAWDPSLAFVMVGAIAVYAVTSRLILARKAPLFDSQFHLPTASDLDGKLLAGAALFGIGWGLGGFCPGPALTTAATGDRSALLFVAAMTVGMLLQHATAGVGKAPSAASGAPSRS